MATQNIESDQSVFDRIASEIMTAFALIIEQTTKRRDQLLTQLNELRIQIQEKIQSQISGLKELEQMRTQIMEMSVKQNFLLKIQEASLAPIENQINDLKEKSVSEPLLRFECPLTEMLDKMETLGAIIDEQVNVNVKPSNEQRIDYSKKILAKRTIGKVGTENSEFQYPLRMHVSNIGLLYVVDRDNKRVQVFDVENCKFLLQFGQSQFTRPNGITANNKFCFITDSTENKIFKFSIEDYSLVKVNQGAGGSNENLDKPVGIAISEDELLYVADNANNRVCVYDSTSLNYVSELGVGMLLSPRDVIISSDKIFVLDVGPLCLHTFDKSGMKLRSILTCGKDKQILTPSSFCLDSDMNILITDVGSRTLKVFSSEGELLHKIGKDAPGTESVGGCFGVALFRSDIFISCAEPFDCIKIF